MYDLHRNVVGVCTAAQDGKPKTISAAMRWLSFYFVSRISWSLAVAKSVLTQEQTLLQASPSHSLLEGWGIWSYTNGMPASKRNLIWQDDEPGNSIMKGALCSDTFHPSYWVFKFPLCLDAWCVSFPGCIVDSGDDRKGDRKNRT